MTHPPTDPLREAAQAVLDCWDSRNWKAAPTADYMRRLRAALAAPPQPTVSSIKNEISNLSVWSGKVHDEQQLVDLAHVLAILDADQQEPTPWPTSCMMT